MSKFENEKTTHQPPPWEGAQKNRSRNRGKSDPRTRMGHRGADPLQKRQEALLPLFEFGPQSPRGIRDFERQGLCLLFYAEDGIPHDSRTVIFLR